MNMKTNSPTPKIRGMKTKLENLFNKIKDPTYKSFELDFLRREYEWIDHPLVPVINHLLEEMITFRLSTDTKTFKAARDQNISQEESLERLHAIENAFREAKATYIAKGYSNKDLKVLADAIQFCEKSFANRIQELKELDDKMYKVYQESRVNI